MEKKERKNGRRIFITIVTMLYDAIAVNISYLLALVLRFYVQFEFNSGANVFVPIVWKVAPFYAAASIAIFYAFRLYHVMWELADIHDLKRILAACISTAAAHVFLTLVVFQTRMPLTYYILGPIIQFVFITVCRFGYKLYLLERNNRIVIKNATTKAMIIGTDTIAKFARSQIEAAGNMKTVCLLDASDTTPNRYMNGLPVIGGLEQMPQAIEQKQIDHVVIADLHLFDEGKKKVVELCEAKGIEVEDFIEYLQNNNDTQTVVNMPAEDGSRVIPFSPPDISDMEINEVKRALKSGWITTGPRTKELEKRLAAYCHTSRAVCLNSATAAEELNFRICGIGEGDEVIVPAFTYTATASAAIHCGAKVIFIDSQKDNCEMDYDKVAAAITERTKAVVAVDLGGIIADYDKLYAAVESKRTLFHPKEGGSLGARIQQAVGRVLVFADCAHALGASQNGRMAGEIADFTDFSFHAVKNFTTAEGGASTWCDIPGIDNDEIYKQFQLYSLHGQNKDALAKTKLGAWEYDIIGPWYKCNMTDIMAAIGLRQLDRYPNLLARRKKIIRRYDAVCDELGVQHLNHYTENSISSGHLYITRIPGITDEQRREIIIKLAERGVSTNVHYKPLPMMTAYKALDWDIQDFPNAKAYYDNLITLPLHTKLSDEDVTYVVDCFRDVVKKYCC